jgi:hypothetical protein
VAVRLGRRTRGSPWVAVIDESLARQYFESEDPIGRRISQVRPQPSSAWSVPSNTATSAGA